MPQTVIELTRERQLILLCTRESLSEQQVEDIREIMSGRLDWKDIFYQCITHRTLNIMYYNLKKLNLSGKVEKEILKIMKNQSKVYALRNASYFEELKIICEKLNENGIRAAVLKGNYLASNVYPSIETRTFNDIDFLIDIKDGDRIVQILEGLGYIQGEYNENTGEIVPGTKKQKMIHRIATHELMECLKKNDNPFLPLFQVDLNFDMLWGDKSPYKINTAELLDRAIPVDICGAKAYVLDKEDFLIQLSCHLYKEAALLHWINDLRDLLLYKFADFMMYVEKFKAEIKWDKLIACCTEIGCEKVIYYAFYYVNLLYGQIIPEEVMKELEPEDKSYLDEYGVEKEKPSKWQYDFFTRLFETNRILELAEDAGKSEFLQAKDRAKTT